MYEQYPTKPSMVQAIAIMCLVDGILNIIWGLTLILGLLVSLVGIICLPLGFYPIVLGVMEIVYAAQLLSNPVKVREPAQYLAIMQIANIVVGDVISLVIGILSLVLYNDDQVKAYFQAAEAQYPGR